MSGLLWLPPLLAAVGAGLLVYVGAGAAAELLRCSLGRRRRSVLALARALRQEEQRGSVPPAEEELYGLPPACAGRRNLSLWMVLAALVGMALTLALLDGPLQGIGLAAGALPILWKRRRIAQARQQVRREVAQTIEELRLRLAFGGSLGTALNLLAAEGRPGIVHERLRAQRDLLGLSGPEVVLERLVEELRSPELRMLLRRVRAARQGGAAYSEALRASADEVSEEIARQAEVDVEGAPLRLMFPMLALLFPPILALLLYPPAYALIASLTGAGAVIP